jgi:hypothetical protein
LPPESVLATASLDQRAILYAETLERIAAAGETVDPGWLRAAVGVVSDLHVKHVPRLLREAPEFAAEVKAGRAQLPQAGNGWYFFWKRREKEASANAPSTPADTEKMSSIGDKLAVELEKTSPNLTASARGLKN